MVQLDPGMLRDAPAPRTPLRAAWSLADGAVTDHPFRAWRRIATDSIWIGHPAAYAGQEFRLNLAPDTLTGILQSHSDVSGVQPDPWPALLIRVPCPDWAR
jgi:hypothetical protein